MTVQEMATTYVSFLLFSKTDHVPPMQRIEWLKALLALDIDLIFFTDAYYKAYLPPTGPRTRIIALEYGELRTVQRILGAGPLRLPPARNAQKDTLEFLAIQNSKAELLAIAAPFVKTPYMAYIDAGIIKVFKNTNTISLLERLRFKDIPLVLLPGCHPMSEAPLTDLAARINWTFCGGFFVVPTAAAERFDELHAAALDKFLQQGWIAWEVNVWVAFLPALSAETVWFAADHNDTMLTGVPSVKIAAPN